ncbi:hypothetical protein [Pseudalkalibacillus hwajinpoensis]|uniref:hypothetical protein n=1 Tax=Guptibacillus hwajinpoensis TaxID=208199 RepID=UPI00384E9397
MKGKCSKLRFVDVRFAGDTLRHKNTNLNFAVGGNIESKWPEAGHSVISLINGGGKGLILQLFTQLFDPLVEWKGGSNTIQHLFYNEKEKPIKYTCYVIGEFEVGEQERLMLGIGITPKIISSREKQRAEKSDINLDYALFAKEYLAEEDFDIYDIPIWDAENEQGLPLDKWREKVERKYKNDIEIFNLYNRQGYFDILDSYGFTSSEISKMKILNSSEGSVESFFKQALTNDGLFYNKIIPAINDDLQNTDSSKETSDLVSSFLNTVKIAKELPAIMEFADSATAIKELLKPVKEKLVKGIELENRQDTLKKRGKAIKKNLEHVRNEEHMEVEAIVQELENTNKILDETRFEKDNVVYMKSAYEKLDIERKLIDKSQEVKVKNDERNKLKKQEKDLECDIHLKVFSNLVENLDQEEDTKSELQKHLGLTDISDRKQELSKEMILQWEKRIKPHWEETINASNGYLRNFEKQIEEKKKVNNQKNTKLGQLEQQVTHFSESIKIHNSYLDKKASKFGETIRYQLGDVIGRTTKNVLNLENTARDLEISQMETEVSIKEISNEQAVLIHRRDEEYLRSIKQMDDELTEKRLEEESLLKDLERHLKQSMNSEQERNFFLQKKEEVANQLKGYKKEAELILKRLWEQQGKQELIDESGMSSVWVPNKDVLKAKAIIESQGVHSMLGVHLLAGLGIEERIDELKKMPYLPNSVVVNEKEYNNIDFALFDQELFNSMVTILVRQEMKNEQVEQQDNKYLLKASPSALVVKGLGYELLTNSTSWEYYTIEVEENLENYEKDLEILYAYIDDSENLLERLAQYLSGKRVLEILVELKEQRLRADECTKLIKNLESKLIELAQEKQSLAQRFKDNSALISKEKENEKELLTWREECKVNQQNNYDLDVRKKSVSAIKKEILSLGKEITTEERAKATFSNNFQKWLSEAEIIVRTIQKASKGAFVPRQLLDEDLEKSYKKPDLSTWMNKESSVLVRTYKSLIEEESRADSQIAIIESRINNLQASKSMEIGWLQENCVDWEECSTPDLQVEELTSQRSILLNEIDVIRDEFEALDKEKVAINQNLININNELKRKKNVIKEKHGRDPNVVFGLDYKVELFNAQAKEKKIVEQIEKFKEEKARLEDRIAVINTLIDTVLIDNKLRFSNVFRLEKEESEFLNKDPKTFIADWQKELSSIENDLGVFKRNLESVYETLKDNINSNKTIKDKVLQEHLKLTVQDMQGNRFSRALSNINGVEFWAENEIAKKLESKKQADEAIRFFTERATKRTEDVFTNMKIRVNRMKIKSQSGEFIEIVRYKKGFRFPSDKDFIASQIREYCEDTIAHLIKTHRGNVDSITEMDVEKFVNISELALKVLGSFPQLEIYIPNVGTSFLKGEIRESSYREWETINGGGDKAPSKSNGQTIMAQMMLISMLQKGDNADNWTLVVTDNLFGAMSAIELIEPLFIVLELLKVQWLTVVPENVKVEITSKFDTVYIMSVDYLKGKGYVTSTVENHSRKFLDRYSIIEKYNQSKESKKA